MDSIAAFSVRSYCSEYFNDMTGITTNQSEGLNKLFKDIQQYKELPLDVVILSFLQLSIYYCNEIKKGYGNSGNYRLKPEFDSYYIDTRYVELRDSISPSEIIKNILQDKDEFIRVAGVQPVVVNNCGSEISSNSCSETSASEATNTEIETLSEPTDLIRYEAIEQISSQPISQICSQDLISISFIL